MENIRKKSMANEPVSVRVEFFKAITNEDGNHTVASLYLDLKKLYDAGDGYKAIVIATDDEGNGYRPLPRQSICTTGDEVQEYLGEWDEDNQDYDSFGDVNVYTHPDNTIIL